MEGSEVVYVFMNIHTMLKEQMARVGYVRKHSYWEL